MATNPNNPKKPAPPASARLADAQRRAAAMAGGGRKSVSPQQFLKEAWIELKKTTWPDKTTLTKSVTVVLALVLAVAIWVGGLDFLLGRILNPLFTATR